MLLLTKALLVQYVSTMFCIGIHKHVLVQRDLALLDGPLAL